MQVHMIRVMELEVGAKIIFKDEQRIVTAKPTWTKQWNVCIFALDNGDGTNEWIRTYGHYPVRLVVDAVGVLNLIAAGHKKAAAAAITNITTMFGQ